MRLLLFTIMLLLIFNVSCRKTRLDTIVQSKTSYLLSGLGSTEIVTLPVTGKKLYGLIEDKTIAKNASIKLSNQLQPLISTESGVFEYKHVIIVIESTGGIMKEAKNIVSMMRRLQKDNDVYFSCIGSKVVASAATYILDNCDDRYVVHGTRYLIHSIRYSTDYLTKDLKRKHKTTVPISYFEDLISSMKPANDMFRDIANRVGLSDNVKSRMFSEDIVLEVDVIEGFKESYYGTIISKSLLQLILNAKQARGKEPKNDIN